MWDRIRSFAGFRRKTPELNESGFVGVKIQAELCEPFPKVCLELFGLPAMLKPHDEVVCVSDDDDVAFGMPLSPLLRPKIEDIVQVHVRQKR